MGIIGKKNVQVTLVMDEANAQWLKDVMQNPLHDQTVEDESTRDFESREELFACLRNVLGD